MSGADFADSNIFVYAYDPSDPKKQHIAREVLLQASSGNGIVASSQVYCEFASVLLHKMRPAPPTTEVLAALDSLSDIRLIPTDRDLVLRAIKVRERYGLHFGDGMIVAAAERGGCGKIWSEDMSAGQSYFGVVVENPFL